MARRGTKAQPDALKVIKGTFQPSRAHELIVPVLEGQIIPPAWLVGAALRVWRLKVEIYQQRGQQVHGCEGALAQYCALEAELVNCWKRRVEIPVARINAHRVYANEFYDTPASQQGPVKKAKTGRFGRNGRLSAERSA